MKLTLAFASAKEATLLAKARPEDTTPEQVVRLALQRYSPVPPKSLPFENPS